MGSRRAFVIMPIRPEFQWVHDDLIRPVCKKLDVEVTRADEPVHSRSVMRDLVDGIIHSDVVIADLTSENANVFYELGAAHALLRPVVALSQNPGTLPFDLAHHRVIAYSQAPARRKTYRARLSAALKTALELVIERSNPIGDFMPVEFRERVVRANRSTRPVGDLRLWKDGEFGVLEVRGDLAEGLVIPPLYPLRSVHWGSAATGWGWDGRDAVTTDVLAGETTLTLRGLVTSVMGDIRGTPYIRTVHDELLYLDLDMWTVYPPQARQRTVTGEKHSSILEFPLRTLPPYPHAGGGPTAGEPHRQ